MKDLSLYFQVSDNTGFQTQDIELIPNGRNIQVDNVNKFRYIYLVANYKLNEEIKGQCNYFLAGLNKVIPTYWLQMFNEYELQMVKTRF